MTSLAVDMSSYLKTALRAGIDAKDGRAILFNDKKFQVNSAEYGYENFTNMMCKTLRETGLTPIDVKMVFEGRNSKSRRKMFFAGYKAGREEHPPEYYAEFEALRDFVKAQWLSMGAMALTADYVEGDDTLAWLAKNTEEDLIIASRDSDLGALQMEEGATNAYGARVRVYNDGLLDIVKADSKPFVHPARFLTLYKALVGDTSDDIPGVPKFGAGAFQKLAEKYGYDGLDELSALLQAGNLDPLLELAEGSEHKGVKLILDNATNAITSWKLAKLYPEWVNTRDQPIKVEAGKVAPVPEGVDSRLKDWYGLSYLVTATEYEDALVFFRELCAKSPEIVFDIETSTPPESDDWLAAQGNPDGVDQLGSVLTGFSFTVGDNLQHTLYVSVDHARTDNITMSQARRFMEVAWDMGKENVIQNTFFELSVLSLAEDEDGTLWRDHWRRYGERGFIPRILDTKIEANYTDENRSSGLKFRSLHHLGYPQVSYEHTTTLVFDPQGVYTLGEKEKATIMRCTDWGGGRRLAFDEEQGWTKRRLKMRDLPAEHVFGYGTDDTICTAALHRYYKFMMTCVDHHYHVYQETELDPCYQHAENFVRGMDFSLQRMNELASEDTETYDAAWSIVRAYLIQQGWAGSVPPVYTAAITAKEIKEAYRITQGFQDEAADGDAEVNLVEVSDDDEEEPVEAVEEAPDAEPADPFLKTKVRTPAKLVVLARELGHAVFAEKLERCLNGEAEAFTAWVQSHFSGEPLFKISNKQMKHLLYEVMKLPVRVRGKPTDLMKAKGLQGNPKADALAITYALLEATEDQKAVLRSLMLMQMVKTRRGLFYSKYPYFVHWKTGRIHPTHNQSHTNTRRASEAKPNKQQLAKHEKIKGQPVHIREMIVPHHPDAVIVSLDEDSQELRIIADYSQDQNMLDCFIGDNLKSMHALTGAAIMQRKVGAQWSYEAMMEALADEAHPDFKFAKDYRSLGKKVNFTTEFGAMAPKLAVTMLVSEAEAQEYIDAKERMFPGVRVWKNATINEAKLNGFVRTMSGAVRHLSEALFGDNHYARSKAERQSVNFKVQSSAAEMIKKAEGRVWRKGLTEKFDAVCYGPVHDELVFSVMIRDLLKFLPEAHWCMVQPFGGMVVPILSSISFGPSFGEQHEIGASVDESKIRKFLNKMGKEALLDETTTCH